MQKQLIFLEKLIEMQKKKTFFLAIRGFVNQW